MSQRRDQETAMLTAMWDRVRQMPAAGPDYDVLAEADLVLAESAATVAAAKRLYFELEAAA